MKTSLRRIAVFGHDMVMVGVAWSLALLVRYDFRLPAIDWPHFTKFLVMVLAVQSLVLWWSGLYRGLWRFASVRDLWNIIRGCIIGVLAIGAALFIHSRLEGVPRSVLVMYPIFLAFLLGAPRLMYRLWKDQRLGVLRDSPSKRVLVLGAGRAGEMLVRDMLRDAEYLPIGFLDDHERLRGAKVHGVPVLGTIADLPTVAARRDVDMVVIAMPSASSAQMRRVVEVCEQTGLPFRTVPPLEDMVAGQLSARELREVSLDDLLGREPVSLDWQAINKGLTGKVILVSGGGGSIGAELCRQLAQLGPKALVVFERSEYNLYAIEMELRREFPELPMYARLGDVADAAAVDHVLGEFRPDVVFHAAAYKHVPLLQEQVREAARNNVLGTKVLAAAADRHGCESFVLISTDKAVNPTNVMGATKRVAEIFCQNLNLHSRTRFITVRFGNVLGSAGSVIPLFKKQIEAGGPVTVTHREITRYFMTIPEACQLITQSAVMGRGGEIFVLDMGQPVRIGYLAEQLIRLSGKVPGKDIDIVYTGLRPGEKLYEELFHEQESLAATSHEKILLARSREIDWDFMQAVLHDVEAASQAYEPERLLLCIRKLVPELQDGAEERPGNVVPLKLSGA